MLRELGYIVKSLSNVHRPDGRPNVFLYSTPRSGSTWLMELIWSQPGFKFCDEPLNLRNVGVRRYLGLTDWGALSSKEAEAALATYFGGFCSGRLGFKNPNPFRGRYYRPLTHRIVFKVIQGADDRLNWLADTFNGRILFLIRHPIAVSMSREVYPRLQAFLSSDYQHHFTEKQRRYAQRLIDTGSKLEQGVLAWCLQNAVPLRDRRNDWAIVTYEQLIREPEPVITALAAKLDLPEPDRMLQGLTVPSAVKAKSDSETQRALEQGMAKRTWLAEKWRERITETEERQVMEILAHFDLDAYRGGEVRPADWLLVPAQDTAQKD
jgi:hypothetical protein